MAYQKHLPLQKTFLKLEPRTRNKFFKSLMTKWFLPDCAVSKSV